MSVRSLPPSVAFLIARATSYRAAWCSSIAAPRRGDPMVRHGLPPSAAHVGHLTARPSAWLIGWCLRPPFTGHAPTFHRR
jgi:hypothetical protein